LRIDARFVEASGHASHPSDGSAEAGEFQEIDTQLGVLDELVRRTQKAAQREQMEFRTRDLQRTLGDEISQLAAIAASVQELERRLGEPDQEGRVPVKTDKAQLKAGPFMRAATVGMLTKGQCLTVRRFVRMRLQ
jgi:hypothetical protein